MSAITIWQMNKPTHGCENKNVQTINVQIVRCYLCLLLKYICSCYTNIYFQYFLLVEKMLELDISKNPWIQIFRFWTHFFQKQQIARKLPAGQTKGAAVSRGVAVVKSPTSENPCSCAHYFFSTGPSYIYVVLSRTLQRVFANEDHTPAEKN